MLEVQICVGSSCHLKGAYRVVETFKSMVNEFGLEHKVHLKASFCQQQCTKGVGVTIGNRRVKGVTPENARETFYREILEVGDLNADLISTRSVL